MDLAELGLEVDSAGVVRSTAHLDKFGRSTDAAADKTTKFGKAAKSGFGAAQIAATALLGTMAGIGATIGTLSRFDSSMSRVSAISGTTGEQLSNLRDLAKDLGSTTEFSASQAADALGFLSMAGFNAAESMKALPEVLDLATASGLALAQTADITSNIMSGFGIAARDTAAVTDVLSRAASIANTDVGQLGQAMSYVAPISKTLGITIGDTAAAIGVLSDAGVQGGRAGSTLRAILTKLVAPSDAAADAMGRLNVNLKDIDPTANSLKDILGTLSKANIDLATATELVGLEAASNLLVLVEGTEAYSSYSDTLTKVTGATKDMAETMRDQLGGSIKGLFSATEGLIIALGDAGLTAVLRGAIDAITAAVRAMSSIAESADVLAIGFGLLAVTRIPAMIGALASMSAWLATSEGLFIAGAVASRSMAVAMNLIPGVAIFTGFTLALTGIYRGFNESARAAEAYGTAIENLASAQQSLNDATDTFYQNMTQANLEAMALQAKAARDAVQVAVEAAEAELAAASFYTNLFGVSLYETERMEAARAAIDSLSGDLIAAEARLSAADNAAVNFNNSLGDTSPAADQASKTITKIAEATFEVIPALDELQQKYGANAQAAKEVLEAQNELAKIDTAATISATIDSVRTLTENLDLGIDKTAFLMQDLEEIKNIDSFGQQAVAVQQLSEYILLVSGGLDEMDDQTRVVYQALLEASDAGSILAQQISVAEANSTALGAAIAGIAPQFAPAIVAANALAGALGGVLAQLGGIASGLASLSPVGAAVAGSISTLGTAFKGIVTSGVSGASGVLSEIGNNLGDVWNKATAGNTSIKDLTETLNSKFKPAASSGAAGASKLKSGLSDAEEEAKKLRDELERPFVRAVESVSDAFGDFVAGGLKDFKGFAQSVLSSFTSMISQMIAQAAKSKIMFSLGLDTGSSSSGATSGASGILSQLSSGAGIFGQTGIFGQIGTTLGTSIGTALGGAGSALAGSLGALGSTIGAALPVVGLAVAAFSFFKTTTTELDAGIRVTTSGLDAMVESFKTVQKVKFFGLSNKISTAYVEAEAAVSGPIQTSIQNIGENVKALSDVLGLASDNLNNTSFEFEVSTKDKTDAEIAEAIEAEMTRLGNTFADAVIGTYTEFLPDNAEIARLNEQIEATYNIGGKGGDGVGADRRAALELALVAAETAIEVTHLNGALSDLQNDGEGSLELLTRIVSSLETVNGSLVLFERSTLEVSQAGAIAATELVELMGGLDEFAAKTQFVFQNLLTDAAQSARLTDIALEQLTSTFGSLTLAVPQTHDQFMALLNAQDLTTEAGRQTYAALSDVAQAFVTVNGTAQQAADSLRAIREAEVSSASTVLANRATNAQAALTLAEAALSTSFSAEADRVTNAYQLQIEAAEASTTAAIAQAEASALSASDRVDLYRSIVSSLEDAYRDRSVLTAVGEQLSLAQGTAFLSNAVSAGGTSDADGLERALSAVADPSTDLFDSFEAYVYDYKVNTSLIDKLRKLSGDTLTVEERVLAAAEQQITQLGEVGNLQILAIEAARDAELLALDDLQNAILGVDTSVLSLLEAFTGIRAAQDQVAATTTTDTLETSFAAGSFGETLDAIYLELLGRNVGQPGLDFYGGLYENGFTTDQIRADILGSAEREAYVASLASQRSGSSTDPELLAELRTANELNSTNQALLAEIERLTQRQRDIAEEQLEDARTAAEEEDA